MTETKHTPGLIDRETAALALMAALKEYIARDNGDAQEVALNNGLPPPDTCTCILCNQARAAIAQAESRE